MKPEIEYVYNKLKKLRFDFNRIDFENFRNKYRYEPTLNRYVRKDDNDLFIDKNTFKPLEDELEYADKCHNLEEQLGCPLDVYVKIQLGLVDKVYLKWYKTTDVKWHDGEADIIQEELTMPFTITRVDKKYFRYQAILGKEDMPFSNYGKEFWLKEDRSK